jgi:hypothetical protein
VPPLGFETAVSESVALSTSGRRSHGAVVTGVGVMEARARISRESNWPEKLTVAEPPSSIGPLLPKLAVGAATNDPSATELNKPTTTKTATAAARRVFLSSKCPFTMLLPLSTKCARPHHRRTAHQHLLPSPHAKSRSFSFSL